MVTPQSCGVSVSPQSAAADRRKNGNLVAVGELGRAPVGRFVSVHPYPGGRENRLEGGSVGAAGRVEHRTHGGCRVEVVLVGAPTGGLTRGGEEPECDGQMDEVPVAEVSVDEVSVDAERSESMFVRAIGYASSRSGAIGSPVTSSTP